jgi:tight adherence protein B
MTGGIAFFGLLVAGAVFLLFQGLIVPAFGDQARDRKNLKRRLAGIEQELGRGNTATLLREKYLRDLSPFQRRLESLPGMERLALLIERSGSTMLPHQLLLLALFLGFLGGLLTSILVASPWGAMIGAPLAFGIPFLRLRMLLERRAAKLEEQLPDAIDVLRRALRAGHPFNAAMKLVSEDMDEPVAKEFQLTFQDINYGVDVRRAILGLL